MNDATLPSSDAYPVKTNEAVKLLTFMDYQGIVIDGQFYVRDTALGEKLGYGRDRKIRDLIDRHMDELSTYGTAPQRGAQYIKGNGAEGDSVEYYLNKDHALIIISYSKAPNAQAIKRMMIAVFKAFLRGSADLTAEQALDRLAEEETSLALASEGAEIQLRKAAVLEAEARRIKEAALAVRATRNDRLALMSASSQILASKEPLPANQTMFGRQLMSLSVPAAVHTAKQKAALAKNQIIFGGHRLVPS